MIKFARYILLSAAVATVLPSVAATSIKVSLDSAAVVMGRLNGLNVEVVTNASSQGHFDIDREALEPMGIDVYSEGDVTTTAVGGDVVQLTRTYYLQAFDSGAYTLPAVRYIEGKDTLLSDELALKVLPVDVSALEDIHPDSDVMDPERKWYDFLPDWITDYWLWWIAALVIIAVIVVASLIMTRKIEVKLPKKAPTPPDRIALRKLQRLRESKMWESGREKEYYTTLVDILREYLQLRFGINAMEMTSTQIMHAVQSNPTANLSKQNIKDIVSVADFVKFAQVRPMPDDNMRVMSSAVRFVEDTRPIAVDPGSGQQPNGGKVNAEPSADAGLKATNGK